MTIQINGRTINVAGNHINDVTIRNSVVYINGKRVDESEYGNDHNSDEKIFHIVVEGNVNSVTNESGDITVNQGASSVKNVSGDVKISGSVTGSVSAVSGDILVHGGVGGSISTVSGDVVNR